ncbi:glycoside hydrolase family 18 protein [Vibrio sp. SM6]|uniref:chitinase n=1 Tax=Vibrio agarilyticus TaxID=2726741 RepID=A0A7X8TNV1_9VIBR|nr:glycoside hydrolase family 18 protein [Vibrio agarilyticus]NLS11881.1 glycoside hydrolase family 18 protein [Vibrio agarilyticus]
MKKALAFAIAMSLPMASALAKEPVVAGYFADWQYENEANPYTVQDIPADKLTHIIYAFLSMCGPHTAASERVQGQIAAACEGKRPYTAVVVDQEAALNIDFGPVSVDVPYQGHFAQLAQLKSEHPNLSILPSFGGWTMSEPFHAMAKNPEDIKWFAKTAVDLIAQYDFFGGIDLDWEYPGGGGLTTSPWDKKTALTDAQKAQEKAAFTLLVTELRKHLDALSDTTGKTYELGTAVGVGFKATSMDWPVVSPHLDLMFAMTYDYLGAWGPQTGHLTNLFATEEGWWGMGTDAFVQQMIDLGMPKNKIVIGATYFGRGWEGTKDFDGQNMPKELASERGAQFGTHPDEPGAFMFWDLMRNYTAKEGYVQGYDAKAEAPYLWNAEKKVFISYDNERSIKAKADWVKQQNHAGLFVWDLAGDDNERLTNAMAEAMKSK